MASLARLSLPEHAVPALARDFEAILSAFHGLAELDVEGLEPLSSPTAAHDVTREDRARTGLSPDSALANAPQRVGDWFAVPKVIGGDA